MGDPERCYGRGEEKGKHSLHCTQKTHVAEYAGHGGDDKRACLRCPGELLFLGSSLRRSPDIELFVPSIARSSLSSSDVIAAFA